MLAALLLAAFVANPPLVDGFPVADFLGEWLNTNQQTRGVASFAIQKTENGVMFHAHRLQPTKALLFAATADARPETAISLVMASTQSRTFLVRPVDRDEVELEMLTQFADETRRSDYRLVERFRRRR